SKRCHLGPHGRCIPCVRVASGRHRLRTAGGPGARWVKILELGYSREVTTRPSLPLSLVFFPTIPDTHHWCGGKKQRWSDHGLEATARVHYRIGGPRASPTE